MFYDNEKARELLNSDRLKVCAHCLKAIESHEGEQITAHVELDDSEPFSCEWCSDETNEIYILL